MKFLPLKFILAKGYAASAEKITFKTTVNPATIRLFTKYAMNGICFQTPTKFSNVGNFGINCGGYWKMFSDEPFNAVEISHRKGNIDKIDTDINIKCVKNPFVCLFTVRIFSFQKREY